jgi:NADPH:quinone reductase-like Zn-dependent oxidoreductase
MRGLVYYRYGSPDVVEYAEMEKPSPKDDEVLIRVRAAALNPLDWHFVRATPAIMRLFLGLPGPREPRLGRDVAGRVEAVGKNVKRFKAGDEVFGVCHGAFAEYGCASESRLAMKPANVTFEQAAAVPIAGLTALQALRDKGHVQPGHRVLINGASGGVGTFAVQVAKVFGAEVTGVCSTRNVDLVRSLGADRVIDYTREDFTRGQQRYDMILDTVANHSFAACRRVMSPNAILVRIGAGHALLRALIRLVIELQVSRFTTQKVSTFVAKIDAGDLAAMADMIASGKVTPVIDNRYKLSEGREAFRYFAEGHARGKVILSIT